MLEFTIYGLVGLVAMLVAAFYFGFDDEAPTRANLSLRFADEPAKSRPAASLSNTLPSEQRQGEALHG
jgi:hypothetical protein